MSQVCSFNRRIFLAAIAIAATLTYAHQAKILSFTVEPRKIHAGPSVTLKWVTRSIRKVTLDWAPAENTRECGDTAPICRPKARPHDAESTRSMCSPMKMALARRALPRSQSRNDSCG